MYIYIYIIHCFYHLQGGDPQVMLVALQTPSLLHYVVEQLQGSSGGPLSPNVSNDSLPGPH